MFKLNWSLPAVFNYIQQHYRAIRERYRQLRDAIMARCRVCGSDDEVLCFDPRGLWAYFHRNTYCPKHCPEHDYEYEPYIHGWACKHCGGAAPHDFMIEH